MVHADGSGLRRLGPAESRPLLRPVSRDDRAAFFPFSPDGRTVTFADLDPDLPRRTHGRSLRLMWLPRSAHNSRISHRDRASKSLLVGGFLFPRCRDPRLRLIRESKYGEASARGEPGRRRHAVHGEDRPHRAGTAPCRFRRVPGRWLQPRFRSPGPAHRYPRPALWRTPMTRPASFPSNSGRNLRLRHRSRTGAPTHQLPASDTGTRSLTSTDSVHSSLPRPTRSAPIRTRTARSSPSTGPAPTCVSSRTSAKPSTPGWVVSSPHGRTGVRGDYPSRSAHSDPGLLFQLRPARPEPERLPSFRHAAGRQWPAPTDRFARPGAGSGRYIQRRAAGAIGVRADVP